MKLVRKIKKNEVLRSDWGIYELDESEQAKYGHKYAVSQGIFCESALREFTNDELLGGLKEYNYEGFFDTIIEACQHVKLVEYHCIVSECKVLVHKLETLVALDTFGVKR